MMLSKKQRQVVLFIFGFGYAKRGMTELSHINNEMYHD